MSPPSVSVDAGAATPPPQPIVRATSVSRPSPARPPATGPLGTIAALDGLRAVAVVLVVGYHLGYSRLAGGYIGVEAFFVLSGWLVCARLAAEHRDTGRVDIAGFWLRRARRLLPAAVVVVGATLAAASALRPDRLAGLRGDAAGALGYHLNWRLLVHQRSYFAAADGSSALDHLWSLSIEEQFYLAFPLLCAAGLLRWPVRRAAGLALAGAALSTVARLAWSDPGADPSRAHFGTDTRASGLLLGVALGLVWAPSRPGRQEGTTGTTGPMAAAGLDAVALAGLGVLAWYTIGVSERDAVAFGAGFTAAQLATLAVIAVVVAPVPTRTGRTLSLRPLRWIGQRSYGIYLLHWPVIVLASRAPGQQPERPATVAGQLALVVALAAASHRWIEQPIRRHGFLRAASGAYRAAERRLQGRRVALATAGAGCAVVLAGTATVAHAVVAATDAPRHRPASVVLAPGIGPAADRPVPAAGRPAVPTAVAAAPGDAGGRAAGAPAVTVTALGDSVMAGGADELATRLGPGLALDARVGRQMGEAPAVVDGLATRGRLGDVVVVHLGNNGAFTSAEIDRVFAAAGPERRVVLVTVAVPRRWEGEVNDALVAAAARHPGARLADWRAVATGEPGLTAGDGHHLSPAGARRYADVLAAAVKG